MGIEKGFKKETIYIINNNMSAENKINLNNINMYFKDFKGQNDFNVKIDPIKVNKKMILDKIISASSSHKYFFEWTNHKDKVKPFYDIDMYIEGEGDEWKNQIEEVKQKYIDLLSHYYPKGEIAISSSHGEKIKKKTKKGVSKMIKGHAISFHFIINNYECLIPDLKKFNEKNKLYDGVIDKAVYRDNGNMRCLYSNKPNDPRTKIPDTFKDNPEMHIIQSNNITNKDFFEIPTESSPPVSPPSSDGDEDEIKDVIDEVEDGFEFKPIEPIKKKVDLNELNDIIKDISVQDNYDYDTWLKVGLALSNITDCSALGKALYEQFSEKYDGFINDTTKRNVDEKWKNFKDCAPNHTGNKLGYTFLKDLQRKQRSNKAKTLKDVFMSFIEGEEDDGWAVAQIKMLEEINQRIIYVKETGEYIIKDKKLVHKEDESNIYVDCWYLKVHTKTKEQFKKEKFIHSYKIRDAKGKIKETQREIDPFEVWCEWINRKEVRAIGFDPLDKENPDIFNLWNGFNISKSMADEFDETEAQFLCDHILNIWCDGDEKKYNYVMNLFAHYIQKPHKKSGVLLALRSKQGGGKGIVLKKLEHIIGHNHYAQNSNANFLFGDFNGQLEGKVVVNLDEAFWGGDKKMEGIIKNKITEGTQTINKKNKENYVIDDFANYIITTNNDWFAGCTEDDRRHYCLELNNAKAGRTTKESDEYFKKVDDCPCEAFAKILYNRDISDFNPRKFEKTKLLQEQVERNHNSVKVWYSKILHQAGWDDKDDNGNDIFIDWNEKSYNTYENAVRIKKKDGKKYVAYKKEYFFKIYEREGSDARKFASNSFYRELKKNCLDDLYDEIRPRVKSGSRPTYIILPAIEDARAKWNELQEYNYTYDDDDEGCICDSDSDDDSDDE